MPNDEVACWLSGHLTMDPRKKSRKASRTSDFGKAIAMVIVFSWRYITAPLFIPYWLMRTFFYLLWRKITGHSDGDGND